MSSFDVIVIGGGAAGMMAAGRAASRGRRVLLLEKNKELGKKLSITGGGRCNITNAEQDIHALLAHYGESAKFLYSPFSQFGVQDTFDFFARLGLPLVVEARKRAFPETQSAPSVTHTLASYVHAQHVTVRTGVKVQECIEENGRITGVRTNKGIFTAQSIILATGGLSRVETGSTGDGMHWLQALGHTVHEPNPDIVPLTVDEAWVKRLSGTTLSFMKITFGEGKGSFSRTGKLLFTHFGLSGPLILNAAREVKQLMHGRSLAARIDLYPDTDTGTLRNRILGLFEVSKNKTFKNVLKECVPPGMQEGFLFILPNELLLRKVHSITKEERHAFVDLLKALPLTITGTMGYDWAVVSDGGVALSEIDTKTMRSKRCDNLYVTGDVLHISRPSGGFSLQLCWTTGWVAGTYA